MIVFVTGTDTGVGKTHVTCTLLHLLSQQENLPSYYKPISTGGKQSSDCAFVRHHLPRVPSHCTYHFPLPASPHLSAKQAGKSISLKRLDREWQQQKKKGTVVVEGIGGLLVPLRLKPPLYLIDLPLRWNLPVLLVARSGVGTLNHTLLSASYLQKAAIPILCIILNQKHRRKDSTEEDNRETLKKLLKIPVFLFPYSPSPLTPPPCKTLLLRTLQKAEKRLKR